MSFRSTGGSDYAFFVLPENVTTSVFTVVYLQVSGASSLLCYSDGYDGLVNAVRDEIEQIRPNREEGRTTEVRADANATIDEKERDALSELDDAESKLDSSQTEIDDGLAQLSSGREELSLQEALAESELDSAQRQIDEGYAQLSAGETELDSQETQARDALSQVDAGLDQVAAGEEQTKAECASQRSALDAQAKTLAESRAQLESAAQTMGAGAAKGVRSVSWGVAKEMVLTWVFTFPGCGIIGFCLAKLFLVLF